MLMSMSRGRESQLEDKCRDIGQKNSPNSDGNIDDNQVHMQLAQLMAEHFDDQ